ncbi:MAG: glycosyltransferase [Acetobacteraceae bacterium]|nr:MAG: glycosyltransferase [Acetobacteraceae bacterium]
METAPFSWAAVSLPVARRLTTSFGLPPNTVTVIPNAVAVPPADPARRIQQRQARRASLGLSSSAPLVIFAGRLEEKKGADLLPALAERMHEQTGATLAALGEGPLKTRLAQHPAARISGPLRLLGQVDDVADWLLAGDALVLPSRLEGCPLIALEALALGCPIVATAAAVECFGDQASDMASVVPEPTVVALTTHISVMLTKKCSEPCLSTATLSHLQIHNPEFMQGKYFTLLRICHAEGSHSRSG